MTKKFSWTLIFIAAIFVFQNCKKEPDKVGSEIIPESSKLKVNYSDTASIRAYSIRKDSLRTDETSNNLLGSYFNPVFGTSSASFYTQVRLSSVNYDFGPNPVLDSLILTLDYSGYYGDTNSSVALHVYEVSEQMYRDSSYYSNEDLPNEGFDYANTHFIPKPNTPVYPVSDTIPESARLSIDLGSISPDLGNKILTADSASLADNENFLEYFKGLYVTTNKTDETGAIVYFDLESAISNLVVYYHNDTVDSLSFTLNINENCAHYNTFEHYNYEGADQAFTDQVINNDSTLGKNILYMQSMAGVQTRLFFPEITNWFENEKILINEARLKIPLKNMSTEEQKPSRLTLYKYLEDGGLTFTDDEYEGAEYFGGYYDSINNYYSFRITRHIQHLMMGDEEDYGLVLSITSPFNNAYHVQLAGTDTLNNPNSSIKLELRYTIVE